MTEEEFNYSKDRLDSFITDLKALMRARGIELKKHLECWHGGSEEQIRFIIDGEEWLVENFEERLTEEQMIK